MIGDVSDAARSCLATMARSKRLDEKSRPTGNNATQIRQMHALSFPRIRCKPAKEYVHNYGMHPCDAGGATDPVPSSPISLGLPCCDVLCCAALFLPCLLEQVIRKVISVGALISGANSQLETQPLLNLAAWTIQNRQCVCFGSRERLGLGFGLVFTCFPSTAQLRGSLGWLLRQRQAPRCVLLPSNGGTVTPWSTAAVSKLAPVPSLPAACSPQPAIASPPAHHNLEPHPAARPIRPSQLGRLDPNQLGRQFPSPRCDTSTNSLLPHFLLAAFPSSPRILLRDTLQHPTSDIRNSNPFDLRQTEVPVHLHHVVETHQECALPPFGSPFLCPSRSVFPPSSDRDGAIRLPGFGCVSTTSLTASSP